MNVYHRFVVVGCTLSLLVALSRPGTHVSADTRMRVFPPSAPQFAQPVTDQSVTAASTSAPTASRSDAHVGRGSDPQVDTPTPTRTPTPINVGNFVWDDLDADGRQDAGDPGVPNVTVQLWNSARTLLIGTTTTNSSGIYALIAPTPGQYRVRVLLPDPAVDQFAPIDSAIAGDTLDSDINPSGINYGFTDIYDFASNLISTTTIDAGIRVYHPPTPTRTPTPINLGNFVWHDLSGDGVQQAGEPGVGGVVVQLWNAAKTQLLAQTTTNGNGTYTLIAPIPDDYRIRVLLPSGASFTLKDQGDNTLDSDINAAGINAGFTDTFTIASNVISSTTFDAGLLNVQSTPTPSITNTPTPTPTNTPQPELLVHLPLTQR